MQDGRSSPKGLTCCDISTAAWMAGSSKRCWSPRESLTPFRLQGETHACARVRSPCTQTWQKPVFIKKNKNKPTAATKTKTGFRSVYMGERSGNFSREAAWSEWNIGLRKVEWTQDGMETNGLENKLKGRMHFGLSHHVKIYCAFLGFGQLPLFSKSDNP